MEQRMPPNKMCLAQTAPFSLITLVFAASYLVLTGLNVYGWSKTGVLFESSVYTFITATGLSGVFVFLYCFGLLSSEWIKELFVAVLSATLSSFGAVLIFLGRHFFSTNVASDDRGFFVMMGILIFMLVVITNRLRYKQTVAEKRGFTLAAIPILIFAAVLTTVNFLPT